MQISKTSTIMLLLLLSAGLQLWLPIFGDEAYFVSWGLRPSLGYYDHPPSIGWLSIPLIWLENQLGIVSHGVLHRVMVLALAIATLFWLRRPLGRMFPGQNIDDLLLAVAALPVFVVVFNSFFNDTILAVFLLVFFVASYQSFSERAWRLGPILLAGLGFGLALQTKYSVGVFYIGLVLSLLVSADGRRFLFGRFIAISVVAGLIFLPNVFWNLYNCNINFAFNFAFRSVEASAMGGVQFLLVLLLVLGPTGFFLLSGWRRGGRIGFFSAALIGVVLVSLAYAVSRGTFRLNWGTPFLMMGLLAVAELVSADKIKRLKAWNLGFSLVSLLPIIGLLALDAMGQRPLERFLPPAALAQFNMEADMADGSLPKSINAARGTAWVASDFYGQVAVLENYGLENVVLISQSIFGRNQDMFIDYSALDGSDILYLTDSPAEARAFALRFFDQVEELALPGTRQTHIAFLGRGFRYETYRSEKILPFMTAKYDASPFPALGCFMDKYR